MLMLDRAPRKHTWGVHPAVAGPLAAAAIACYHGLRTPDEGINQKYLKNLADVADKICFGRTKKFGIGIEFSAVQ
jgi:hypothetical protein